ncbi:MmcQ/YjbR family DNA-binding protein [Streptococcus catagoni]|uniref:MmcQ/YjbR family DNA-binding protein n=1 Tax=Streptococcus catagoni TaxID=2654874 RepID=UPI00140DE1FC|nr:MmcQ/YjbR family DNA-binding protein [Streptococcus catagoni]
MTILSDVFKQRQVKWDSLKDFGFKVDSKGTYNYSECIMADDFRVDLSISKHGQIEASVFDLDLEEEYLLINLEDSRNAFANKVQAAYQAVLEKIAEACFDLLPFRSSQMNRLSKLLKEHFNDPLDHPFEQQPDYLSYRVCGKWYALIFPLKGEKLEGLPAEHKDQEFEIVNVKVKSKDLPRLLEKKGIYPSYHMSKKSWVSVTLDDSLTDDELWLLFQNSRALVSPSGLSRLEGPDYWLIPANLKYYDIDAEFAAKDTILWTQKASIKKGDYLFIYITAPTRAIRYACLVLESDIDNQGYRKKANIHKLMRLRLLEHYDDWQIPFEVMKEKNVQAVRGPRRMSPQLITYLEEKEYFKRPQ